MTERVAVIIVNWNGLEYLQTCLPALLAQTEIAFETLVVDNGSTDGSVEWLQSTYPEVQLIRNSENRGFAEANNQGIRVTHGEYVVLLNNDTQPSPGWLASLVAAVERDDCVGMVASQICLAHTPGRLDSAGIEVDVLGMAWNRRWGEVVAAEPSDPVEVFGPSAAAALYRRKMLDEIGLFDERYFAYYEDVELAWRARRAGWRCLYVPTARVLHIHSATASRMSGFKAHQIGLNKWRTLFRHYPFRRLWIWAPLLLLIDVASWFGPLVFRLELAPLRGRWQAWKHCKALCAERHHVLEKHDVSGDLCLPRLRSFLGSK
jgi:hypothetical protein